MGRLHLLVLFFCIFSAGCQQLKQDDLQKNITQLRVLLEEIKELQAQNDDFMRKKVAELSETLQKIKPKHSEGGNTTGEIRFLLEEMKKLHDKNTRSLEEQLSKQTDEIRKLSEILAQSPLQNQIPTAQLENLLKLAIKNNDDRKIFQLLLHISVEHEYENKNKPIHLAVELQRPRILETLLNSGADIDAMGEYNRTALLYASQNNCLECGRVLLKNGANMEIKDTFQNTALHLSAIEGHTSFVNLLLENGADVNAIQQDNKTALHLACEQRQTTIMIALLKFNADKDIRDKYGNTPLDIAESKGYFDIVSLLQGRHYLTNNRYLSAANRYLEDNPYLSGNRYPFPRYITPPESY